MTHFIIHFCLCNLLLSGITGILLVIKKIFKNVLSPRMHYHAWFLLLFLLVIPFLPSCTGKFSIPWTFLLQNISNTSGKPILENVSSNAAFLQPTDLMQDFTVSVNQSTSDMFCYLLGVWFLGIVSTALWLIRSKRKLHIVQKSALPLQNNEVQKIYRNCLAEIQIKRIIPLYSTAFLKSPMISGLFRPRIYFPIHLISQCNENEIRYMLLHELQHYKTKDSLANTLVNFALIFYWFNPFIWIARKEMLNDRELACDASVLTLLDEKDYVNYGKTLIHFIEKANFSPFASGINGNRKQITRRIQQIAVYQKPSPKKFWQSLSAFILTAILLFSTAPFLSSDAADNDQYLWVESDKEISFIDASATFENYHGSFVLYDSANASWTIYNLGQATNRISPDSTYKIYSALFALEEGRITPTSSKMIWSGTSYPFDAWNQDQTLETAMSASVNWYFQSLDAQIGEATLDEYFTKIHYGNSDLSGGINTYWLESSLKISPIEQVELLSTVFETPADFTAENIFAAENVTAVKHALHLSSGSAGNLYGKTGTGRINDQNINGWFVGFLETNDNTYYFATNIQADGDATGRKAAQITLTILEDFGFWIP